MPETAPVRSMTGFGHAERDAEALSVRVELRSLNGRHLKISSRLPAALDLRLSHLEGILRERLERGTVSLTVRVTRRAGAAPADIDADVLADYARQLAAAAEAHGLPANVDVAALLRLPGVIRERPTSDLSEAELALVDETLREAVAHVVAMREAEGTALCGALAAGIEHVERLADRIEERVPAAVAERHARLRERLDKLLADAGGAPEEQLAREIALLAERSDVAEELVRLRSHAAQWRAALEAGGPTGRRLDFLSQELGREANTIGSKTNDETIAAAVVELKLEIDRLKEQAANVE